MSADERLRGAITVPAFLKAPDFGGPVSKVALLAEALAARGHDVHVLTADYGPDRTRTPAETVVHDGYTASYLETSLRYRWTPIVAPGEFSRLRWDFDIVHVCGLRDGVGVGAIRRARKRGIPYVVEPLGMAPARLRNAAGKRVFDALITDRQLRHAKSVIATSEREREQLKAHYGFDHIDVRWNPLALARTDSLRDASGDGSHVVFVGRLCRTKNLPALLEAVQALDGVRLTIAGPDDNDGTREAMEPLLEKLRDRVTLRGWVDTAARDALIDSADLAILPSATENFGNFAAEAAARRRPVVVTNACGVADFMRDAAVIVDPTVDGLREGIAQLVRDAAKRHELAEAGWRRVQDLDPAGVAEKQEQIYRDAIALGRLV